MLSASAISYKNKIQYCTVMKMSSIRSCVCWVLTLLLVISSSSPSSFVGAVGTPRREVEALQRLHNSTRGEFWRWRNEALSGPRWDFSRDASGSESGAFQQDPCSSAWQGLTCSSAPELCSSQTCHITELALSQYSLSGFIPSEVGDLEQLRVLDLDNNQLTGSLPAEVGQLLNLQEMLLFNNTLTGPIPTEVGSLVQLVTFDIFNNALTGSIPGEIGQLVNLKNLEVFNNFLDGPLPIEVSNLVNLEVLYLFNNKLTGMIPSVLSSLQKLEWLGCGNNLFSGSLPSGLSQLVKLEFCSFISNLLTGPIPSELSALAVLDLLELTSNALTGSISHELGGLDYLQFLFLQNNDFTGSIPVALSGLIRLDALYLHNNALMGPIPRELGTVIDLNLLQLGHNALTGPIPEELGDLVRLTYLDLFGNSLTGTIPIALSKLVRLDWLYLHGNSLTGAIPTQFSNFQDIMFLGLNDNLLSGPIPSEVGLLTNLRNLMLQDNFLTGPIPNEIGNLTRLKEIDLENNAISGTISSGIFGLSSVEVMDIQNNLLSGIIPTKVGILSNLQWLVLNNNILTGSVPQALGELIAMQQLVLSNNNLTGSIPLELGSLRSLQVLDLRSNALTGGIPSALGKLDAVHTIFLQSNQLSSGVEYMFNASIQRRLEVVDLSDNLLAGRFGEEVFRLPALRVLALSVNCFDSSLTEVLCEAKSIEVLSLNGLGSADGCGNKVTFPLSGVLLFNTIGGTLPECVWHLRNLNVLHAVGNELRGELVPELSNTSHITDVSLSHNRLSGIVPLGFQKIQNVDLSNNQFTGKYSASEEVWSQQKLNLEINRLSGELEVSKLWNVTELDVLRGNMISCNTIPSNDDYEADYICGSADLNESYNVFIFAVAAAGCAVMLLLLLSMSDMESVNKDQWLLRRVNGHVWRLRGYLTHVAAAAKDNQGNSLLKPISVLCAKLRAIMFLFVLLFLIVIVLCVPIYIVRGSGDGAAWSTHVDTYAWFWTFAYLRGTVPAVVILVAWGALLGVFYVHIWTTLFEDLKQTLLSLFPWHAKNDADNCDTIIADALCQDDMKDAAGTRDFDECCEDDPNKVTWVAIVAVLLNATVSIAVNTLYIIATQQPLSPLELFGIQTSLAVFRLIYSLTIFPLLSSFNTSRVANIRFRGRLQLVSNLVIPCVVTLFASPSCFQGLIVEADALSTPYMMDTCLERLYRPGQSSDCLRWVRTMAESAPVTPPFVYNSQCASVILTSFIPVLIIGYSIQLIVTLGLPMMCFRGYKWVNFTTPLRRNMIPGVFWPALWLNADTSDTLNRSGVNVENDPTILVKTKSILCSDVLNNATIMLTFGLCSPVLATAVVCVVVLKMRFLELQVARFAVLLETAMKRCSSVEDGAHLQVALVALGRVPFPLREVLRQSFWLMAWASALFFALVCWDMACDEVTWLESLWVPVSAMCYPLVLYIIGWFMGWQGNSQRRMRTSESLSGVELAPTSSASKSIADSNAESIISPIHEGP